MTIRLKRQRLKHVIACGSGPKYSAQDTAKGQALDRGHEGSEEDRLHAEPDAADYPTYMF